MYIGHITQRLPKQATYRITFVDHILLFGSLVYLQRRLGSFIVG